MKSNITLFLKTLGVMGLLLWLSGCYVFEFINQPESIEPGSLFEIEISIGANPYNMELAQSYFSIMLPHGWQPADSFAYTGTDTGMYRFSSALSDSIESQDSAIDGYRWWTFVSDTLFDLYEGSHAASFSQVIQADTNPGIYYIDYRLGYTDDPNLSYVQNNSNPIWSGIEPFPLDGDIYVSLDGSDANTGLTIDQSLKTISAALERVLADTTNPRSIFIASGEYKPSSTGERFPLRLPDYVSIIGNSDGDVLLDAEGSAGVLNIYGAHQLNLSNLTLTGGHTEYGGGLYCRDSDLTLSNVTVTANSANEGGGIYSENSNLMFSSDSRCNIYGNRTNGYSRGHDIFSDDAIDVVVDTFSVLNPTEFHCSPLENFTFDIHNAIHEQVSADLYISVNGNDSNDGLSQQSPLKTIRLATSIILADSDNPRTIFLENGTYSPSTTGEIFPIDLFSYISLSGESEADVILDAQASGRVMRFNGSVGSRVENLTITGGSTENSFPGGSAGSGVDCINSNPVFQNVTIGSNGTDGSGGEGGGFYCFDSNPSLLNVTINDNRAARGGGFFCEESNPLLENVLISGNYTYSGGGGVEIQFSTARLLNVTISDNETRGSGGGIRIHCGEPNLRLHNVSIMGNSAEDSGGGLSINYCRDNPSLENLLIVDNTAIENWGGGIACEYSNFTISSSTIAGNMSGMWGGGITSAHESSIVLQGCILWDNSGAEVYFNEGWGPHAVVINTCNLQGGSTSILDNNNGSVNWIGDNIDMDPLFCDPPQADYHLAENSPCLGATQTGGDMGALGVGCTNVVATDEDQLGLLSEYALHENFPNPFNPTTTISYDLPEQSHMRLAIYDVCGREIALLQDAVVSAGSYDLQWNGVDQSGTPVSTGLYFARLDAGGFSHTIKMMLIK